MIIAINGVLYSQIAGWGNNVNTINQIQKRFTSFQAVVEARLNSIFIFACISASTAEFISENTVNMEVINIEISAKDVLYHGRKNASPQARKIIPIHKTSLSDIIFPTIFDCSSFPFEISRIAIVYSPISAKNAKIER